MAGIDPTSRPLAVRAGILAIAALSTACRSPPSAPPEPARDPAVRYLKGQLHAHTRWSGDGEVSPRDVAAWYAQHGFDFVVFTDHNRVTDLEAPPGILAFRGVELTENLRTCDPPPRPREACLLHVNALFVTAEPQWIFLGSPPDPRPGARGPSRADVYGRSIDRAIALGGIAQLNHPNFKGGADEDVVVAAAARGARLLEIANEASDSENEGGPGRPSTEALWDRALLRGARIFGTATDDAHHFDGPRSEAGRGFVMVHAAPNGASIRAALEAGDFYASTGIVFDRVSLTADAVELVVREDGVGPFTFHVLVNGAEVERREGTRLSLDPRPLAPGILRVRVTDGGGRRAWTQPISLPPRGPAASP